MTQIWIEDLHARVAAAIKAARGSRSAQWLADETARLGYPISRSALANYESGRKKGLDLGELMVIAFALRVPPGVLLFPELPDGAVELVPGVSATSWDALKWFSGEGHPPGQPDDQRSGDVTTPNELVLVRAVRRRDALLPRVGEALQAVLSYSDRVAGGDQISPHEFRTMLASLRGNLERLRDELGQLDAVIAKNGGVFGGG